MEANPILCLLVLCTFRNATSEAPVIENKSCWHKICASYMWILFILSPLLLDTIVLLKYNTKKRITCCIEIECRFTLETDNEKKGKNFFIAAV